MIGIERQFAMDLHLASLRVRHEGFLSLGYPAHGPADFSRGPGHENIFREIESLHAETTADIAGQDMNAFRRDTEAIGNRSAHRHDALRAHMDGIAVGLVVVS